MQVFSAPDFDEHEQVVFASDASSGLRAIIAIHNTRLGPALGGVRMLPYSSETEALQDVLRLSRGMTYKAAMLGVPLGGGKSVIIGDPHRDKTPELLRAMGTAIARLNRRYICGEDIGTNPDDMREIRVNTKCVSCLRVEDGGYGDPASLTALGVFSAIRAGLKHRFGSEDFTGLRVAVQGVGNVGFNLCSLLAEAGAKLTVSDTYEANLYRASNAFECEVASPNAIYDVKIDVFAPCAVGAILNEDTIPRLSAKLIAGAANNQLEAASHAKLIADYGITYIPDYVANGGGLISCAAEWYRTDFTKVPDRVRGIYDTCIEIVTSAARDNITTSEAADCIARSRLSAHG